jgi:hypothetical protein
MKWIDIKIKELKTAINAQSVTDAKEFFVKQTG